MAINLSGDNNYIIDDAGEGTEIGITIGNFFIWISKSHKGLAVAINPSGFEDAEALAFAQVSESQVIKALAQLREEQLHSHPDL